MRIVHTYQTFDPRDGGPAAVITSIALQQLRAGHEVTLISSDPVTEGPNTDVVAEYLAERFGVPPPRLSVVPTASALLGVCAPELSAVISACDVLHVHAVWPPSGLLAAREARRLGRPYVLTAHGQLNHAALRRKRLKKLFGRYVAGYDQMIRHAGCVQFLNEAEKAAALGPKRRGHDLVISNGVDPSEFSDLPERGAFRRRVPGLGSAPFILFLARLHPQKSPMTLLSAFERLQTANPELHLVFVGPDQGELAGLRGRTASAGLESRVHVVGPVLGSARIEALRDAAVFCLPSVQEGQSVAVLEALAAGTPCVLTTTCDFNDVVTARCGLVVPRDPRALADALDTVLRAGEREQMGERGRALVFGHFTWEAVAKRVEVMYALCRGKNGGDSP